MTGALAAGLLLPLAAGAMCVAGFAPFYAWPLPVAALAALLFAWTRSGSPLQAFLSGYAFGLGLFLGGVSWVYVSMHVYGAMPAPLAAAATFLFCAYLALFPAGAGWVARRLVADPAVIPWAGAASFVAFEWGRGWLFTGFPWLTLGTTQAPSGFLAGWLPVVGGYGTTLAIALVAAGVVVALVPGTARRRAVGAAAALAVAAAGPALGNIEWTTPAGPSVTVALLQGNVPQQLKWRDEIRTRTLAAYREMIFRADARIVIIPETALPAFYDQLPADYLEGIRQHARATGKEVLMGTVEREFRGEDYEYYNSLARVLGRPGEAYRKHHLVPFGEFVPWGFRWFVRLMQIPLGDFTAGAARQPPLVAAGVAFGVAICYEDIFGEEVIDFLPRAQALINVSNDAWFGESWAADQHLQSSQARALETGRWMVRSTNTGATAAIDPRGRVASRLPPFVAGTLVAAITPMEGLTPYARLGNVPALLAALALLAAAARLGRRR